MSIGMKAARKAPGLWDIARRHAMPPLREPQARLASVGMTKNVGSAQRYGFSAAFTLGPSSATIEV